MSQTASSHKRLLFISYAYEDEYFAKWLARKLALFGYGVWFDQIRLLGGESWVAEVDEAIKDRSFRVLAILSKNSINKPNPRKERTLAFQISKAQNVPDFLITLNLDGTTPDWTLSDISWISFNDGWAKGLRGLLNKLKSVDAPKIHSENPAIAAASLETGSELVSSLPELIATNWMRVPSVPPKMSIYRYSDLPPDIWKERKLEWPCWDFKDGTAASVFVPKGTAKEHVLLTKEAYSWRDCSQIRGVISFDMVSNILKSSIACALRLAGCIYSDSSKAYYIPESWHDSHTVNFTDIDASKRLIRTNCKVRIRQLEKPPRIIRYQQGIRFRPHHAGKGQFLIQIKPCIVPFDENGGPIIGRSVGPLVKRITKSWWNDKWRKRLFAFSSIITEGLSISGMDESQIPTLITLNAALSINEKLLEPSDSSEDEIGDVPAEKEPEDDND